MKLPLTVERVTGEYWPVIKDADGKELANQEVELDENEIRELVLYANAYHKVKQVVDKYRSAAEPVTDSYRDAQISGCFQDVLNIVAELEPK
jgi:hypothetical protein